MLNSPSTPPTSTSTRDTATVDGTPTKLRTKRRYAHELYPHPAEDEIRPLTVEVPYLYARAIGFNTSGTGWSCSMDDVEGIRRAHDRIEYMIACHEIALLADALLQGLGGQEAWDWAHDRLHPDNGEMVWARAVHHGVDPDAIKPYPCGPEPDHHWHEGAPDARGWIPMISIAIPESQCPDCCEPIDALSSAAPIDAEVVS